MNDVRPCLLGCRNAERVPYRAAPGWQVCARCSDKLRQLLDDIQGTYTRLTDVDELIPGGHGDTGGGRRPPGPRSPAVDGVLVHTDRRSANNDRPAALAQIEGWARLVREERSLDTPPDQMLATVPAGRVTMQRELGTLRFHWDWIMAQPWVADFAGELRSVLAALQLAGRDSVPVLKIGKCPTVLIVLELPDDDSTIELDCGAPLRVRADSNDIKCRNCGTVWPRARWHELGDRYADYATLSDDLGVAVGTLWRWASEDGWRKERRGGRLLVHRDDAEASWQRRKTNVTRPIAEGSCP